MFVILTGHCQIMVMEITSVYIYFINNMNMMEQTTLFPGGFACRYSTALQLKIRRCIPFREEKKKSMKRSLAI